MLFLICSTCINYLFENAGDAVNHLLENFNEGNGVKGGSNWKFYVCMCVYNHKGFCNGTIFVKASMIVNKSKVHIRRKYLKVIILCNN